MTKQGYYYEQNKKSNSSAYILWFLLGCHYAYLNKWIVQIVYWLTLGGFGFWALVDLFRIPGMVDKYNERLYDATH